MSNTVKILGVLVAGLTIYTFREQVISILSGRAFAQVPPPAPAPSPTPTPSPSPTPTPAPVPSPTPTPSPAPLPSPNPPPAVYSLQVRTYRADNAGWLTGVAITLQSSGLTSISRNTLADFSLERTRAYTVTVNDSTGYAFDHWEDGDRNRTKSISANHASVELDLNAYMRPLTGGVAPAPAGATIPGTTIPTPTQSTIYATNVSYPVSSASSDNDIRQAFIASGYFGSLQNSADIGNIPQQTVYNAFINPKQWLIDHPQLAINFPAYFN